MVVAEVVVVVDVVGTPKLAFGYSNFLAGCSVFAGSPCLDVHRDLVAGIYVGGNRRHCHVLNLHVEDVCMGLVVEHHTVHQCVLAHV